MVGRDGCSSSHMMQKTAACDVDQVLMELRSQADLLASGSLKNFQAANVQVDLILALRRNSSHKLC